MKLYLYFLRFSFSKAMEFRFDWWSRIFMDVFYYAMNLAFFKIIFLHTATLAGWSEPQALVFISIYLVVDALHMTMLAGNMYQIALFINDGSLDYYLTRPVSSLFFLTLREFSASSFVNLLMATGILAWTISGYPGAFGLQELALIVLFIMLGFLVYYCLRVLWSCQAFWTETNMGTDQLFYSISNLAERPDAIYRGWVRWTLITVIPFGLIASFPARIFFGEDRWYHALHMIGVTGILFCVLLWAWGKSIRAYSSASS